MLRPRTAVFPHDTCHSTLGSRLLQRAIEKADVLIEALEWIRQFRNKITVIAGRQRDGGCQRHHAPVARRGLHGHRGREASGRPWGGAAISRAMAAAGLQPRFVQGRRYTDKPVVEIVERVLAFETNESIARKSMKWRPGQGLNFRTQNVLVRRAARHPRR